MKKDEFCYSSSLPKKSSKKSSSLFLSFTTTLSTSILTFGFSSPKSFTLGSSFISGLIISVGFYIGFTSSFISCGSTYCGLIISLLIGSTIGLSILLNSSLVDISGGNGSINLLFDSTL